MTILHGWLVCNRCGIGFNGSEVEVQDRLPTSEEMEALVADAAAAGWHHTKQIRPGREDDDYCPTCYEAIVTGAEP